MKTLYLIPKEAGDKTDEKLARAYLEWREATKHGRVYQFRIWHPDDSRDIRFSTTHRDTALFLMSLTPDICQFIFMKLITKSLPGSGTTLLVEAEDEVEAGPGMNSPLYVIAVRQQNYEVFHFSPVSAK